jgi:hypothetical protein
MLKLAISFVMFGLWANIISSTTLNKALDEVNSTSSIKAIPEFTDCDTYLADLLKLERRRRSTSSEIERDKLEYELACINYILDILNENGENENGEKIKDENMVRNARRVKGGNKQMRFWKRGNVLGSKLHKIQKFW